MKTNVSPSQVTNLKGWKEAVSIFHSLLVEKFGSDQIYQSPLDLIRDIENPNDNDEATETLRIVIIAMCKAMNHAAVRTKEHLENQKSQKED